MVADRARVALDAVAPAPRPQLRRRRSGRPPQPERARRGHREPRLRVRPSIGGRLPLVEQLERALEVVHVERAGDVRPPEPQLSGREQAWANASRDRTSKVGPPPFVGGSVVPSQSADRRTAARGAPALSRRSNGCGRESISRAPKLPVVCGSWPSAQRCSPRSRCSRALPAASVAESASDSARKTRIAKQVRLKSFGSCGALVRYGRRHVRLAAGAPPPVSFPAPLVGPAPRGAPLPPFAPDAEVGGGSRGHVRRLRHERAGAGRRRAGSREGDARAHLRGRGQPPARGEGRRPRAARRAAARRLGPPTASRRVQAARDLADGAVRRHTARPPAASRPVGVDIAPGSVDIGHGAQGDRRERPGRDEGGRHGAHPRRARELAAHRATRRAW